jgi:hypothetical protein
MTTTAPARSSSVRSCTLALRRGRRVACPDGGCALARALAPERVVAGEPCVVERIARPAIENPLVVFCLDELRRSLEGPGARGPARAPRGGAAGAQ